MNIGKWYLLLYGYHLFISILWLCSKIRLVAAHTDDLLLNANRVMVVASTINHEWIRSRRLQLKIHQYAYHTPHLVQALKLGFTNEFLVCMMVVRIYPHSSSCIIKMNEENGFSVISKCEKSRRSGRGWNMCGV